MISFLYTIKLYLFNKFLFQIYILFNLLISLIFYHYKILCLHLFLYSFILFGN